jgi:tripartite ATP-independent transporter DctM subunit
MTTEARPGSDRPLFRIGIWIDHISMAAGIFAGFAMFVVSLLTTYDAIMRRFFNRPTDWVFSVSLFTLMWFVLLAAPIAIKEDRQIVADFFLTRISSQRQLLLKILASLLSMIFIGLVGYFGLLMCLEAYSGNIMNMELVEYPKWVLYAVFPLSGVIILLQLLRNLILLIGRGFIFDTSRRGDLPKDLLVILPMFFGLVALGIYFYATIPFVGMIIMVLTLLLCGIPAAFALGLSGIVGLFITQQGFESLTIVPVVMEGTLYNFVLLAIPMFTMGGIALEKGGIGMRIFDFADKWAAALPGGLAIATVVACALISAMIGVSSAVAAAVGLVALPQMISRGYHKELAYGSVAGGALGVLIPPSAGLIVYGYLTNSSVGVLFAAAFGPAFLLVSLFVIFILIKTWGNQNIQKGHSTWAEKVNSLKTAIPGLLAPAIVLGGIYSGLFTPTESAGVLVIYSLIVSVFYKEMSLKTFTAVLRESAVLGSAVMFVMVGAMLLSNEVALLRIPRLISQWLVGSGISNFSIIVGLLVMYSVLGMFLDGLSITVLTIPVLYPLMSAIGLDVIAFGVVLMIYVEMALITPPVGMNLFILQAITNDQMWPIARGNIPFAILMFITAVIVLLFPDIALFLPRILGLM